MRILVLILSRGFGGEVVLAVFSDNRTSPLLRSCILRNEIQVTPYLGMYHHFQGCLSHCPQYYLVSFKSTQIHNSPLLVSKPFSKRFTLQTP